MSKRDKLFIIFFIIIVGSIFYISNNSAFDKNLNKEAEEFTEIDNTESADVEEYLRANIKFVATNEPVLGGTWYVVSTTIDPSMKAGSVVYEDGHIQSSATFKYRIVSGNIEVFDFTVLE